ncbi:MAG: undecaprenyldiphospho-muramoylpentapeptide beta-N-acetylglucosaminyltransferase [Bacteroidetes bacterium]|nr:undecaprenyldiphospho-muramoylpentapeptide beta-N-acetylglucosaminyltransferase [Bacteroidota bacterium]
MQQPEIRVVISGGGTGGHIFPAIAIANALKAMNEKNEILFVGANGRMEMEKVPAAGYRIEGLNISGIQRKFSLSNLKLPFKIIQSVLKARAIVRSFKPDVAIGVGGYASGPLLYAAGSMHVPTLIQEQNSFAGITNKILSKRAQRICVAYEGMEKYFPAEKIVLTGNPVRQDILNVDGKKEEGLRAFGLSAGKKTVLVIGGSLGARTINECLLEGWEKIADENIQMIWQTGKFFFPKVSGLKSEAIKKGICITEFIQRMDLAYAAADVVISRAGASSVSELTLTGKPSILVPSPNVAEDHQTKNAMALVNRNAAVLVKDANAKTEMIKAVLDLVHDEKMQIQLSAEIKKMALPDSAKRIAEIVYELAGNKSKR